MNYGMRKRQSEGLARKAFTRILALVFVGAGAESCFSLSLLKKRNPLSGLHRDRVSGLGLIDWQPYEEKNCTERGSLSHPAVKGCATRYSVKFARLGC